VRRRILGSVIVAAVAALAAGIAADPSAPMAGTAVPGAEGVTLNATTVELVAAKPTASPCNGGNGNGVANGRCPTPSACAGPSCKPLLSDSRTGPILTASNMKPGDTARGTVVITANGNVYVTLFESNVAHTGAAGSGNLAHRLTLTITDQSANAPVYNGALDSMPSSVAICGDGPPPHEPCQRWDNNEAHTFLFVVTFPNAGDDSDNAYQHTGASVDFIWGATR
jgi:hypothetical protein